MKRILICFGTRPEAIKLIPLYKALRQHEDKFTTKICVTGQHRELLDQVLHLFEVKPAIDLKVMRANQSLYELTSSILLGMKDVLEAEKPDLVVVQGDTTTTFVTALAAFYSRIDVAQVEAGLRTYNLKSPWPEEANRQLSSRLCRFSFAPTESNRSNLKQEHFPDENIVVTGNTVIDALMEVVERFDADLSLQKRVKNQIAESGYTMSDREFLLVTAHRRENFGAGLEGICLALKTIAERHPELDLVYPVHLNPNVQEPVRRILGDTSNVFLTSPLDYGPFVYCMQHCVFILSDSGGVQEEAPSLGKPVLVLRDTTERQEAVVAGTVRLVGTDKDKIIATTEELLQRGDLFQSMSEANNPYGDGTASQKCVQFLIERYGL